MKGQKDNLTTNRGESSHLIVPRGSPKCCNHLRNFSARAMSTVHSMSQRVIDSVLVTNAHLGADNINDSPASFTRGRLHNTTSKGRDHMTSKYLNMQHQYYLEENGMKSLKPARCMGYDTGVSSQCCKVWARIN